MHNCAHLNTNWPVLNCLSLHHFFQDSSTCHVIFTLSLVSIHFEWSRWGKIRSRRGYSLLGWQYITYGMYSAWCGLLKCTELSLMRPTKTDRSFGHFSAFYFIMPRSREGGIIWGSVHLGLSSRHREHWLMFQCRLDVRTVGGWNGVASSSTSIIYKHEDNRRDSALWQYDVDSYAISSKNASTLFFSSCLLQRCVPVSCYLRSLPRCRPNSGKFMLLKSARVLSWPQW